ncbi:DUF3618 domain-containing protein [Actinomyces faecalis]|uniref:DUF3618 domain-containing protein n=1 Tax=Actinomyces faecalis TaxID=2722820 RepID=UPI001556AC03|nr:DUF3618 domain-containing protein [Actinomyces faecalis]
MSAQDRRAHEDLTLERTPEEIEAHLARQRADLVANVDALADRVSPSAQVHEAVEEVKASARELGKSLRELGTNLRDRASQTLSDAREGEPGAVKAAVAGGALATAAVLGLAVARRSRH